MADRRHTTSTEPSARLGLRLGALAIWALLAIALVLSLVACTPTRLSTPGDSRRSPTPPSQVPPSPETALMLELVNEARASARRCGSVRMPAAAPLAWNDDLALAARRHSRAMAEGGFLAHVSPSGSTVGERVAATGYRASAWGETIAGGYREPLEVVPGFLSSPPHCEVLMWGGFEALGAALVELDGSIFESYWTLVLAAPH